VSIDERALGELIEESQDLQTDAMRAVKPAMSDLVEAGQERRASGADDPDENRHFAQKRREMLRTSLMAGGGAALTGIFGSALLGLLESPALAQSSPDVQILQTAASLENLAVATYKTALTLPFIGGSSANATVKAFAETTMSQHSQHGAAFNSAVAQLGGKKQDQPNKTLLDAVVTPAVTKITASKDPKDVVDLALKLENTAIQDYVVGVTNLSDANGKKIMASIMGVESQHAATLSAVKALLAGGAPQLITIKPAVDASKLPAAAGSVGFPDEFIPFNARPDSEGATK